MVKFTGVLLLLSLFIHRSGAELWYGCTICGFNAPLLPEGNGTFCIY